MAPGSTRSADEFSRDWLERAIVALAARSAEFARTPVAIKIGLLRECSERASAEARAWVAAGVAAKQLSESEAGAEWLAGPLAFVRTARLLAESLDHVARYGRPPLGTSAVQREDDRFRVDLFPGGGIDKILFGGFTGWALMQPGMDRAETRRVQAECYQHDEIAGGVSVVVGTSEAASTPLMDALSRLFVHGQVCLLVFGRGSAWLEPIAARVLAPLVRAGYVRVAYTEFEEVQAVCAHEAVSHVHFAGDRAGYQALRWGPPGAERDGRLADGTPALTAPMTAHVSAVTPVIVTPHAYTDAELAFQARGVASMVASASSGHPCVASVVVTAREWPQRSAFLDLVVDALGRIPQPVATDAAREHQRALTAGRASAHTIGEPSDGRIARVLLRDLDPGQRDEPLYHRPSAGLVVGDVAIAQADPAAFLDSATRFANNQLSGTFAACLIVPVEVEENRRSGAAFERALANLRYGVVAINHGPAVAHLVGTLPWGAHPSTALRDVHNGRGFGQNTFMLGGVEKAVLRGPLAMHKLPVWFADNPRGAPLAERMMKLEAAPPAAASALAP